MNTPNTQSNPLPRPDDLGDRAGALWDAVTEGYSLRVDEIAILEAACREIDLIDRMEAHQSNDSLFGKGFNGQPVAAPLLQELRAHRMLFARLMGQLKLPNEDGSAQKRSGDWSGNTSEKARAAAAARWGR